MVLFAVTIFISAFLLFQIQPMISKVILPWFGGTPSVWSTAMLFFQLLLLGGYAYANIFMTRLNCHRQATIHLILLSLSLVLLTCTFFLWDAPIIPNTNLVIQSGEYPIISIIFILTISVGIFYFLLSTTGPLIQAWTHHLYPDHKIYHLYSLSNIGSLLALLSYPFIFEPHLAVLKQADLWVLAYIIFACLTGGCAIFILKSTPPQKAPPQQASAGDFPPEKPRLRQCLFWISLTACASVMLLASTNQISQEIAVIPFLWILPLTLYLLTFILCFAQKNLYSRRFYGILLFFSTILYFWIIPQGSSVSIQFQIFIYSTVMFSCCMICHGELARLKPHPRHLTTFYLMMAIGGALGGIIVALIAPVVFYDFWEFQIGLISCWICLTIAIGLDRRNLKSDSITQITMILLAVIILTMSAIFALDIQIKSKNTLDTTRNFYGVLRVRKTVFPPPYGEAYKLYHGAVAHGFQLVSKKYRYLPTAYFTPKGGIGTLFHNHPRYQTPLKIGIIGLGIGTLAYYGRPDHSLRFYEINPNVIDLAEGRGGFFSYLKQSPSQLTIIPGDARISLKKELTENGSNGFDIFIIDAFSSGSIPLHLLTEEAFQIYLKHMAPKGIIALHISNQHLNLEPVIAKLAEHLGLQARIIYTQKDGGITLGSKWAFISINDDEVFQYPGIAERMRPLPVPPENFRLWTDDYNNLLHVLK